MGASLWRARHPTHGSLTRPAREGNNPAPTFTWRRELRASDAVQFAAALKCQPILARYGQDTVFACFDKELRRAARTEGLDTWPD